MNMNSNSNLILTSWHRILECGVPSPGHPVVWGQGARPLGLVEPQREVEHAGVVVVGGQARDGGGQGQQSECQKLKEEVQLSKYSKGESFYVAAVGGGLVLQPPDVLCSASALIRLSPCHLSSAAGIPRRNYF